MRRSLRYIFLAIPMALLVVAGGTAILLPQLAASRLAARAEARQGLTMTVEGHAGLSFSDGLAVTLDNVTFMRGSKQGVPTLTVGRIIVPSPLAQLGGEGLRRIRLIDPVFTFTASDTKNLAESDTAAATAKATVKPLNVSIENGAVKAADPQHNLALAITDISGEITQVESGALEAGLRGLFNGVATELALSVDDVRRLEQRGSPSDVTLTSKAGQVVMSGRLRFTGALQFDGSVSAEAQDTQSFLSWMGVALSGFADGVPLALDAGLSIAQSQARFSNLAFSLGGMQAKGSVALQAAAPRPAIKADLAFNSVNLNIYSAHGPAGDAPPPDLTQEWREASLPFNDLKAADAEIAITTDEMTAGAVKTGPTALRATLTDGALVAHAETQALFGGKGVLDLTLQHGNGTQMKLGLDVTGATAKDFLGKAFGVTFLSGPVDVKGDLSASGSSPAQLVSTLAGTARVALRDGEVDGIDLAKLAGFVSTEDIQGWGLSQGSATAVSSASATATFSDGIATLSEARLTAAGLSAKIEGNVDLLRRAVNLVVTPEKGLPLPVAAKIKGPWENPKLSAKLDVDGALRGSNGLDDVVDGVAKDAANSAKKALKKLLGD